MNMGIALQNNYASNGHWNWLSVPARPTEWELMLVSLELTEDEAWRQLGIGGAKATALRRMDRTESPPPLRSPAIPRAPADQALEEVHPAVGASPANRRRSFMLTRYFAHGSR